MKIFLYIIIIAASVFVPVKRLDIADLEPVEVVAISLADGQVQIQTDTGASGRGATASEALQDLRNQTPAVVYLDTAKYLLIGEGTEPVVADMTDCFRPGVKVSGGITVPLEEAGKYLDTHADLPTIKQWKNG